MVHRGNTQQQHKNKRRDAPLTDTYARERTGTSHSPSCRRVVPQHVSSNDEASDDGLLVHIGRRRRPNRNTTSTDGDVRRHKVGHDILNAHLSAIVTYWSRGYAQRRDLRGSRETAIHQALDVWPPPVQPPSPRLLEKLLGVIGEIVRATGTWTRMIINRSVRVIVQRLR